MQNDGDFPESATKVSETLATDKLAENEVKEEVCVVITDDIVSLKEGDIDFKIKGRLTRKSEQMSYNQVRQGKRQTFQRAQFDFTDSTGKIMVIAFATDCSKWHPLLVKDSMYYVEHAILQKAKYPAKGYSALELMVTEHTKFTTVEEDPQDIPLTLFENLEDIIKKGGKKNDDTVNIVVLVQDAGKMEKKHTPWNDQAEYLKMQLIDETVKQPVSAVFWEKNAVKMSKITSGSVVEFTDMAVSTQGGIRSFKGNARTDFKIDPQTDKGRALTNFLTMVKNGSRNIK